MVSNRRANLLGILRFVVVGVGATVIHSLVAFAFIYFGVANPLVANISGFLLAACFSYSLLSIWCFQLPPSFRSLRRFFTLAICNFILVSIVTLLVAFLSLSAYWTIFFLAMIMPVVNYSINRFGVFG